MVKLHWEMVSLRQLVAAEQQQWFSVLLLLVDMISLRWLVAAEWQWLVSVLLLLMDMISLRWLAAAEWQWLVSVLTQGKEACTESVSITKLYLGVITSHRNVNSMINNNSAKLPVGEGSL